MGDKINISISNNNNDYVYFISIKFMNTLNKILKKEQERFKRAFTQKEWYTREDVDGTTSKGYKLYLKSDVTHKDIWKFIEQSNKRVAKTILKESKNT